MLHLWLHPLSAYHNVNNTSYMIFHCFFFKLFSITFLYSNTWFKRFLKNLFQHNHRRNQCMPMWLRLFLIITFTLPYFATMMHQELPEPHTANSHNSISSSHYRLLKKQQSLSGIIPKSDSLISTTRFRYKCQTDYIITIKLRCRI